MDRPVGPLLAVLTRAVDRVDDPHPALGEARGIVLLLFRKQAIVGPLLLQCRNDEVVGRGIAGIAERLAAQRAAGADVYEQAAGGLGEVGREVGIGHGVESGHLRGSNWRTM